MLINYSFIIPHKNTPDLLQKCLGSIPRREDVQIIVVDDNSDADKVDFSHFPGLDDPKVEVYLTKEGKGAGFARNVGLSHAIGKWIVFADADDFFNPCINEALDKYRDNKSDIIFFKGNSIKLPSGEIGCRGNSMNVAIDKAIHGESFSDLLLISTPVRKFIRHEFLTKNKIIFNEVKWSNDVVFSAKVNTIAKQFEASDLPIYCITQSSNSLVRYRSIECFMVRFKEGAKEVRIFKKKYPSSIIIPGFFNSWMWVYKKNKVRALLLLPTAIRNGGIPFIKYALKAKFVL